MNAIERLFLLSPFWSKRADFYRDLANSTDDRELLRE